MPLVEVVLSPSLVQGKDAPPQIVRAIERLNRHDLDVIIVARGGGSLEDLWCFNDEGVARAVAGSRIPIISGVGHEIDFTIVDFVADLRAPTPSAAAELATPNRDDLLLELDRLRMRLAERFDAAQGNRSLALERVTSQLRWLTPMKQVEAGQRGAADLQRRLARATDGRLTRLRERLDNRQRAMHAGNPANILARGYALVMDERGDIIRSAAQVLPHQRLDIKLARDDIKVKVEP